MWCFNFTTFFREELEVGHIDVNPGLRKNDLEVRVRDDHSLLKAVLNSFQQIDCMYIVEIRPPLVRKTVFVVPIDPFDPKDGGLYRSMAFMCTIPRVICQEKN